MREGEKTRKEIMRVKWENVTKRESGEGKWKTEKEI